MFRNYLSTALRNLARNKLYAGINILGLAIGLAAALLIALFVRDELSYDKFITGHERSYLLTYQATIPGRSLMRGNKLPPELAAQLKLEIQGIEAIARLSSDGLMLRYENIEGWERVYWADPGFFNIVPLPVFAGTLATALSDPNGIVLTRRLARKYFGREDVVGQTLELSGREGKHPMQVKAVLEDLPSNTHLDTEILASGLASFSGLTWLDTHWRDMHPNPADDFSNEVYVYVKLRTGTSIETVRSALPDFLARHKQIPTLHLALQLVPLADIHLHPSVYGAMKAPGSLANVYGLSIVGFLIVVVAVVNFVNLSTAQVAGRAMEVGVRKAMGAKRRDLAAQFVGESLLHVAVATALATSLVELFLPTFNAFLQRTISLWNDPLLFVAIPMTVVTVGILAGLYPATILSALRPIDAMGKHAALIGGSAALRQVSVAMQFAVLIGLIVSTLVIYRQTVFATTAAVRLDTDQVLLIANTRCSNAFKDGVQALSGVKDIACSRDWPRNENQSNNFARLSDGSTVLVERIVVDAKSFQLYGLTPLAGRFFSEGRIADVLGKDQTIMQAPLVINEAAVHRFGFASPKAAIGQFVTIVGVRDHPAPSEIIGVVADFPRDSVRGTVAPSVFFVEPAEFNLLSVKLAGHDMPETLKAIDKLWQATAHERPISRLFLNQYIQDQYADMRRDTVLLTAFATVALSVAALGLFALSAFTAERRTKEIGIRKAMGAETGAVMRLLVWQFTKPVLWANLIAWPVAGFVMNRWLHGFAYHIDLEPWVFFAATATVLVFALLTVSVHCYLVARAKPIVALRYE